MSGPAEAVESGTPSKRTSSRRPVPRSTDCPFTAKRKPRDADPDVRTTTASERFRQLSAGCGCATSAGLLRPFHSAMPVGRADTAASDGLLAATLQALGGDRYCSAGDAGVSATRPDLIAQLLRGRHRFRLGRALSASTRLPARSLQAEGASTASLPAGSRSGHLRGFGARAGPGAGVPLADPPARCVGCRGRAGSCMGWAGTAPWRGSPPSSPAMTVPTTTGSWRRSCARAQPHGERRIKQQAPLPKRHETRPLEPAASTPPRRNRARDVRPWLCRMSTRCGQHPLARPATRHRRVPGAGAGRGRGTTSLLTALCGSIVVGSGMPATASNGVTIAARIAPKGVVARSSQPTGVKCGAIGAGGAGSGACAMPA
jgi:hypothetical protein